VKNVLSINRGNCFTVARLASPAAGIALSFLAEGGYCALFGKRGIYIDPENPCRVVCDKTTSRHFVYRASLNYFKFKDGSRLTFAKVHPHENRTALVKVELHEKVVSSGRKGMLQECANYYSEGVYFGLPKGLAGYEGDSSLVKVLPGEKFSCYFQDGGVRSFYYNGHELVELYLSAIEVIRSRIDLAWKKLDYAYKSRFSDEGRLRNTAMSQILNFFFYIESHEDREVLFEEFFLRLPKDIYEQFEMRLRHTIYLVDKAMFERVPLLTYTNPLPQSNVVILADCRRLQKVREVN
jgi:hypothetical protein